MSENDVKKVQNSLDSTRHLTEQAFDRCTVLDCFQQKTNELQESTERIIYLESQLKIAKEALSLKDAEFSFRQSEYEAEIQSLNEKEKELRNALTNSSNMISANCTVDLKLEKDRSQAILQKYTKWKKRAQFWKNKKNSFKSALKSCGNDISKLQNENIELANQVQTQKTIIEEEKSASYSLSSETGNYSRKLQKAESKVTNLLENNHLLSGQVQQLMAENTSAKDQIQALKTELKAIRKKVRADNDSFQARFKEISSEKNNLEANLRQIKTDLKKKNMEIEELSSEKMGVNTSNANISSKISEIEEENQKLRLQNQSLTSKIARHQSSIEQMKKIQPNLQNCEEEMVALCDIVGIEPETIDKPWTNLSKVISDLVAIKESFQNIKEHNTTLQKRVLRLQSEKRNESKAAVGGLPENDLYYERLTNSLNQVKQENDDLMSINEGMRRQLLLSAKIVSMHNTLVNQITDLHSAIFDSDKFSLRPVILSIVFARRFTVLKTFLKSNDAQSLSAFNPRIAIGAASKIADIRERFVSLTQDLLSAKNEVSNFTTTNREIVESKDTAEFELRNSKDQLIMATKKLDYLKNRIYELQEDLSTLISPEIYQNICQKLAESEQENAQLIKKLQSHSDAIAQRESIEKNLQEQITQIKIDKKQYRSNIKEIRAQLEKKEKEFDALQSMLREKTKEVLSLERMVQRHATQNKNDSNSIQALSTENQEILQNVDTSKKQQIQFEQNVNTSKKQQIQFEQNVNQVSMRVTRSGIASIINPSFLQ